MFKSNLFQEDLHKRKRNTKKTNRVEASVEFFTENNEVFCFGVDENQEKVYVSSVVEFGLFVFLENKNHLMVLAAIPNVLEIRQIKCDVDLRTNSTPGLFFLFENENPKVFMYKLVTSTFQASKSLFYTLSNHLIQNKISVPADWSLEIFLLINSCISKKDVLDLTALERINLFESIVSTENGYLQISEQSDSSFLNNCDVVVFDLETISPNESRVPTGEHIGDVLFSSSILRRIKNQETGEYKLSCITNVYLPNVDKIYFEKTVDKRQEKLNKHLEGETLTEVVFNVFDNEKDILIATLDQLDNCKFTTIWGYNSASFDFPYLKNRIAIFNLEDRFEKFYHQDLSITYGHQSTHIDFLPVARKLFSLNNYKLSTVASFLSNSTKVDLSARHFRHAFRYFLETPTPDLNKVFNDGKNDYRIEDVLFYNAVDSILVYNLAISLDNWSIIRAYSKIYNLNFSAIMSAETSHLMSAKFTKFGFKFNSIFVKHHHRNTIALGDFGSLVYNEEEVTSLPGDKSKKFGGGFNICDGLNHYPVVDAFDFACYYPNQIEAKNISHETVFVIRADILNFILKFSKNLDLNDIEFYWFYDRRSLDKNEVIRNCRRLMFHDFEYGKLLTKDEIENLPGNSNVIVLVKKFTGVLVRMVEEQNKMRNACFVEKSNLGNIRDKIESLDLDDEMDDDDEEEFAEEEDPALKMLQSRIQVKFSEIDSEEKREKLLVQTKNEENRIEGLYRAFKVENCSLFGLLGSKSGIQGKFAASALAFFCATCIVQTGKEAQKLGGNVVFSDTDSIFVVDKKKNNLGVVIPKKMKEQSPFLILGCKQYKNLFVFKKKTYICTYNDTPFSRGITKNGPAVWEEILFRSYEKILKKNCSFTSLLDAFDFFKEIYNFLYDQVELDLDCAMSSMSAKELSEYKTNTPVARMIREEENNNPNLKFGKKVNFFTVFKNTVNEVKYVSENEKESISPGDLNLYIFLKKISTYIGKMINFFLMQHFWTTKRISYDFEKEIGNENMKAFLFVRDQRLLKYLHKSPNNLK